MKTMKIMPSLSIFSRKLKYLPCCMIMGASLMALILPANSQEAAALNPSGSIRGMVQSSMRIEIRPEIAARVKVLKLREGQDFKKGDRLYELDCTRLKAEYASANAGYKAARIDLGSKRKLLVHQAIGKNEVILAEAALEKAKAEMEIRMAVNRDCAMDAPFDGRVVEVNAADMEFVPTDRPLMVIMDDRSLEVELVVPSHWLSWLKTGEHFDFIIDETGQTHAMVVSRIGAEVDAVSQTIKIVAGFDTNKDAKAGHVLSGMSGAAFFRGAS